jgi:hypothetical protein
MLASVKQLARHCADTKQDCHYEFENPKSCQRTDTAAAISNQISGAKFGAVVSKS